MNIEKYISKNNLNEDAVYTICLTILYYDETLKGKQKIDLTLQLFNRNPKVGILSELFMDFNGMEVSEKEMIWDYFKQFLAGGESHQRKEIEIFLWLNIFGGLETTNINEVWKKIVDDYRDKNILKRLLTISSPIPFNLKNKLYQKVIENKEFHDYIFESLESSFFCLYGKINIPKAQIILSTLEVDNTTERYIKLDDNLKRFSSKAEYWNSLNKEKDLNFYNPH